MTEWYKKLNKKEFEQLSPDLQKLINISDMMELFLIDFKAKEIDSAIGWLEVITVMLKNENK